MRYKVTVSYDGANYCGWQVQPNGVSVQSVIEEVLTRINKKKVYIVGSGRTDALVSAAGQVFHFDSEINMTEGQWLKAMNSLLPKDIRIMKVEEVNDEFHARYDAKWKKYRYTVNMGEYDVLNYKHELEYNERLDVRTMRKAASYMVGTHDFRAFNANSLQEKPNQIRTIYEIKIQERNNKLTMTFTGDGFMRYMVRMLSQTLIEVGRKRVKPERIKTLLERGNKNSIPYNAKAEGLCLVEVGYTPFRLNLGEDND